MIVRPDIVRARLLRAGLETDGRLALEIASYAPFKHSWPYAVRFLETFSSAAVAKATGIDIIRERDHLNEPPEPPQFISWSETYSSVGDCIWHAILDDPLLRVSDLIQPSDIPNQAQFKRCQTVLPDNPSDYPYWRHLPCACGRVIYKLTR